MGIRVLGVIERAKAEKAVLVDTVAAPPKPYTALASCL